jgi:hypothetical protein
VVQAIVFMWPAFFSLPKQTPTTENDRRRHGLSSYFLDTTLVLLCYKQTI